jgi:hypothetical protein
MRREQGFQDFPDAAMRPLVKIEVTGLVESEMHGFGVVAKAPQGRVDRTEACNFSDARRVATMTGIDREKNAQSPVNVLFMF